MDIKLKYKERLLEELSPGQTFIFSFHPKLIPYLLTDKEENGNRFIVDLITGELKQSWGKTKVIIIKFPLIELYIQD